MQKETSALTTRVNAAISLIFMTLVDAYPDHMTTTNSAPLYTPDVVNLIRRPMQTKSIHDRDSNNEVFLI